MTRPAGPPVEYLRQCSSTSLRYFEISKLEHVANLRRELTVLLEEMTEESALALFARWMIDKRCEPPEAAAGGRATKAGAARRARRLLADFVAASDRSRAEVAGGELLAELEGRPEAAMDLSAGGQSTNARAHGEPPARATARPEKRVERKPARAVRPAGRPPADSFPGEWRGEPRESGK